MRSGDYVWRIDDLLRIRPHVKILFRSAEPLLSRLEFSTQYDNLLKYIDWVIVGGESGSTRKCELDWIGHIVSQCREAKTKIFIKQLGDELSRSLSARLPGDNILDMPQSIRIREFP